MLLHSDISMHTKTPKIIGALALCLWTTSSCEPEPDGGLLPPADVVRPAEITATSTLWASEPDLADSFSRAEGEGLGLTSRGTRAWRSVPVGVATVREGVLFFSAEASAVLENFTVDDFALSVRVRREEAQQRWSIVYRNTGDGGYSLTREAGSLVLHRGSTVLAETTVAARAGTWERVQIVVSGGVHRILLDEREVLEAEDSGNLVGSVALRGSGGVEVDDLWIQSLEPPEDSTDDDGSGHTATQRVSAVATSGSSATGGGSDDPPILLGGGGGGGGGDGGAGDEGAPLFSIEFGTDDPIRLGGPLTRDLTVPTTLHKQVAFLYEGGNVSQVGADLTVLTPPRIALVHGWVRDAWGQPIANADVWALGHPEFGSTTTRADGSYDLVVAGGSRAVVVSAPGYLTAHRKVVLQPGDTARADDVVLLELDPEASLISFVDPIEVHHAFTLNDGAPDRMATVMFRQGTQASMLFADETTAPLSDMTVRLTEFTVGEEGPLRMPSALPPGTAYNYAVEISADEAEAAGAVSVELDTPASLYVDNFLSWPVGALVPSGAYDRVVGRWKPEPDGRVIEVVGVDGGGLAEVDISGDGLPATATELADLGFDAAEREELASIYAVGAQLWRTPVLHFTPFDLNPSGEDNGVPPDDGLTPDENAEQDDGCEKDGSIVGTENRDLGERVAVAGTPFSLEYRSSRTRGAPNRSLEIQTVGADPPEGLVGSGLLVQVAGRTLVATGGAGPFTRVGVQWDGLDAFGEPVQGPQPVDVCVAWLFPEPPRAISGSGAGGGGGGGGGGSASGGSFGKYPAGAFVVHVEGFPDRTRAYLKCYGNQKSVAAAAINSISDADKFRLGGLDAQTLSDGLGGWTLDVHHTLARATGTLYLGNGDERELADEALWTASRFAGNRETLGLLEGDARGALYPSPSAIAADPEGNLYIATPGLVRRVDSSGSATIVAGVATVVGSGFWHSSNTAQLGYGGDGGPATAALLSNTITGLAADSEGGLYIADAGNVRVRYVAPDGIIETIAGSGSTDPDDVYAGVTESGGNPLAVSMVGLRDIALAGDEEGLVVAQETGSSNAFVRVVTRDGDLIHVAGSPAPDYVDPAGAPWDECPDDGETCTSDGDLITSNYYGDTIPDLAGFLDPHQVRAEFATFERAYAVATRRDELFVADDEGRIRRIGGTRGGNVSAFRREYTVEIPLECSGPHCEFPESTDIEPGLFVADLYADNGGLLYTTANQQLWRAQGDLSIPQELLAGGPEADVWMAGDGDVVLASRLRLTAATQVIRAADGAIYVADRNRDMVYRIARAVPPMYLASSVASEDGTELYLFDDEGRHLETRDARTQHAIWTFSYSAQGLLTGIVDRFGDATTVIRDSEGDAAFIESPDGQTTGLARDANGFLSLIQDPNGAQTSFSYTATGLMESRTDSDSESEFGYDAQGRLASDEATISYQGVFEGVAAQSLQTTMNTQTLVDIRHTSAENLDTYYRRERIGPSSVERTVLRPDGTQSVGVHRPEVDSVTFADGTIATTRYGLDPRLGANTRLPTEHEVVIPGGPTSLTTYSSSYDEHCSVFTEDCDPFGDLELDADRVVDTLTRGSNTSTEVFERAYEAGGSSVPATVTQTTPLGRQSVTTLNSSGLVASATITDRAPATYGYDARGRVETITVSDGVDVRTTTLTYDVDGFVESVTDPLNQTTTYTYDDVGRVVTQVFPDGRTVGFAYDEDGNRTRVTPPGRPAHEFSHDSVDRTRAYEPPDATGVPAPDSLYDYDFQHRPELVTDAAGDTMDHVYDPVSGQLSEVALSNGSYVFTYDPATGQVQAIDDPDGGSLAFQFQGFLPARETLSGSVGGSVSWTYDDQLRVDSESVNDAHSVVVVYDEDGSPTDVGALELTADPVNADLIATNLDDVIGSYAYNAFGEVTTVTYEYGGQTLYDLQLQRDPAGRVEVKTETRGGVVTVRCYEYDAANRLVDVYAAVAAMGCTGTHVEHYAYDSNGNRTEVGNDSVNLTAPDIAVDDQDRLLDHGTRSFTYTASGFVDTRNDAGAVTDFDYDVAGNLRHVSLPDLSTLDYVYDGRDRRVGKLRDGVLEQGFLYGDALNPVAELDASGAVRLRFVYGTRRHVPDYMVDVTSNTTYRIISDALGSVVAVVDVATGTIAQELEYDSWGRIISDSSPGFQPFGFAGGLYDRDTGWVLFGARDYRPEVGAWSAKDPLGFDAGDANLYRYTLGDPVNLIDPTGEDAWGVAADFAAGFGDSVSFGITRHIREAMDDSSGVVDPCSTAYSTGEYASIALSLASSGVTGVGRGGLVLWGRRNAKDRLVTVTSWASRGIKPDLKPGRWVILGRPSYWNFLRTGLPGPKFQYGRFFSSNVPYTNSITGQVWKSQLKWPSGADWFRGFFGQRIIR